MISEAEYGIAREMKAAAEETINAYHSQEQAAFALRMKVNPIFKPEELTYSAYARCKGCGAGLAYPKKCGVGHYWDCADVLTGKIVNPGKEHIQYPFAFYSIKSEDQPSVKGATTRPQV